MHSASLAPTVLPPLSGPPPIHTSPPKPDRLISVAQLVGAISSPPCSPPRRPRPPPTLPPSPPPPLRDIKRYAKLLTPFIFKLYSLVSDPSTNSLCEWASAGSSFVVHNSILFSAQVLPLYFKHNQFSSFVRQLNKYSFHKLTPGACVFGHTHFRQHRPDLLLQIGPPRPQDRGLDRSRHSPTVAGGASLSSLHHTPHSPQPHHASASMSRLSHYDDLHQSRSSHDRQPSAPQERVLLDRFAVEDMFQHMRDSLFRDHSRQARIAKTEQDALVSRVDQLERANAHLLERLRHADERIERLERAASDDFLIRKRRTDFADNHDHPPFKRIRGRQESALHY